MESNQATWDTGFGQITMIPVAAGGLPPKGQDFNGIFNQISENVVYLSKGGRFKFSADYAASIEGYPKGAILQSDDEKKEYQSIIDNNKVNFNTATQAQINAAWKLISTDDMLQQLAGKQPAGNYANGDRFKTSANNVSISTSAGDIQLILQSDGTLFMWDGGKSIFRVSATGEINVGTISYSQILNVPIVQSTGASLTSFMSQKAVSDALAKLQTKGDYADGEIFKSSANNASITPKQSGFSLILQNDGSLFTWNGSTSVFSVSPQGVITKGAVPYERLTNVPIVQSTGTSLTSFMSQKAVSDASLGSGTVKNVVNERIANTQYVNSSQRARSCVITGDFPTTGSASVEVDGVTIQQLSAASAALHFYASFIVPAGKTYILKASGSFSLGRWTEIQ
ncbi:hypothetical protein [Providencia stuartii]|uniref:hypothetical protein n=1 Tax=Providencia stuartii TaxID=588 RepID=UPI001122D18D